MTIKPFPPPGVRGFKRKLVATEVYILMADTTGSTFSTLSPTGEYVLTEEEAKAWIKEGDEMTKKRWISYRDYKRMTLRK